MARDARVMELEFLSRFERSEWLTLCKSDFNLRNRFGAHDPAAWKMFISLLITGLVIESEPIDHVSVNEQAHWGSAQKSKLELEAERKLWVLLGNLKGGSPVSVTLSHAGAVRISELREQLRSGRQRDPFGILFAQHHTERAIKLALLEATKEEPVALIFADMNGLKHLNDTHDHEAGNAALRAYFTTANMVIGEDGECFRDGGDEVVVVMRNTSLTAAGDRARAFLKALGNEKVKDVVLTASCGVDVETDPAVTPEAFRQRVDQIRMRGKQELKQRGVRANVLTVGAGGVEILEQ